MPVLEPEMVASFVCKVVCAEGRASFLSCLRSLLGFAFPDALAESRDWTGGYPFRESRLDDDLLRGEEVVDCELASA